MCCKRKEYDIMADVLTKQELASKIWSTADSLRGKIRANEYKDYIIGFMFYMMVPSSNCIVTFSWSMKSMTL